jgi:hypothetical protein
LAGADESGKLLEGVKGLSAELGVINADTEIIFDEEAEVDQAERIDQAAGNASVYT